MRILVTNDDGIHAPGLKVCEEIARELSDDVWVVAPEYDQSGVSHSLSLNDPLRLREVGERHYAVKGTPTDCVIMGARHIMQEHAGPRALRRQPRPQRRRGRALFRHGRAARRRRRCSAFRRSRCRRPMPSATRRSRTGRPRSSTRPTSSSRVLKQGIPRDVLVNVNFPDCTPGEVKGVAVSAARASATSSCCTSSARHDGRGNPYYWIAFARGVQPTGKRRHRPLRARRQPHRGDAAAARSHRRAVHDQARRAVSA